MPKFKKNNSRDKSGNDYRTLFLAILRVNLPALQRKLGPEWGRFRKELSELLQHIEVNDGTDLEIVDKLKIVDQIILLTLRSPAKELAGLFLRNAHRLAGGKGNGMDVTLKHNGEAVPGASRKVKLPRTLEGGLLQESSQLSALLTGHKFESRPLTRRRNNVRLKNFLIEGSVTMGDIVMGDRNIITRVEDSPKPIAPPRYLSAKTRDKVKREEVFALVITVTTEQVGAHPGEASTPIPDLAGKIMVNVHGPGVEFLDGSMRLLEVPAQGDSSPVMFMLKAVTPGVHKIEVTAWNGAAHVAGLTVWIAVEATPNTLPDEQSSMDMREPEPGEYTLEIVYEKENNRYRFQLRGESVGVLKPEYSETLTGTLQTQYENMLDSLNRQARNLNRLTPELQYLWLKGLGKLMTEYLVPRSMRSTLWYLRNSIRRLNILCDGDLLPWELLFIPSPGEEEGVFLAEGAGVARWRYGPPPPTKIRILPPYLVHPKGSPVQTADEINRLHSFFPNAQVVRDMGELVRLLTTGGFGMLHFASHNNLQPDDAGGSYVPFGEARFDLVFMGNVAEKKYASTTPLVFMNACTSAGKAPLFTDVSSWADRYLRSGAGAFVGSLWEVRDQSAPEFAAAFYQKLTAGGTLGEAVKAGREVIKANNSGDPTRLAYTLYGNPLAKLQL